MSPASHIANVVVVGGGITAWSAAAALKRRIPSLNVRLIETSPASDALADRIVSTLPSIVGFHADIGLRDEDVLAGARSGVRLGTRFEGWSAKQPNYVHAYGPCGAPVGGVAFHQLWARDEVASNLPRFDCFSVAAQLAETGETNRFASQPAGLQLTVSRYGEMMKAYAKHLGVEIHASEVRHVEVQAESGFIATLGLDDGVRVTADLFVDCSGPASWLQNRVGASFVDWSRWLPCDRMLLAQAPVDPTAISLDSNQACGFGWLWRASSPAAASTGAAFSSAHAIDEETAREIGAQSPPLSIRQGRRSEFWVGNCVAIGDSAVVVEPLEWTNLHLVHSQLDRLVAMMPGPDCAPVEVTTFNNECCAEADRVRDFLCMHYICSDRPEPFWREAAAITPPPSLEHTLALFKERGRLPHYEEETFSRDSWLTVLLGQGVRQRRIDRLADLVSPQQAAQAFAAMLESPRGLNLHAAGLPDPNEYGRR